MFKALKYVIQNYQKKIKTIFLDNWTIRIRIFWKFRCREQVISTAYVCKLCASKIVIATHVECQKPS